MFNGHTMSLVTDLRMIPNQLNDFNFLSVAAITTSDYPNHPNIYNASILMPPTEILMAWAEGQTLVMQNEYPRYLMSKDPDDMIVALIAAMTKRNIILYIPQDEFNIYGSILLNHIYFVYVILWIHSSMWTRIRFRISFQSSIQLVSCRMRIIWQCIRQMLCCLNL